MLTIREIEKLFQRVYPNNPLPHLEEAFAREVEAAVIRKMTEQAMLNEASLQKSKT